MASLSSQSNHLSRSASGELAPSSLCGVHLKKNYGKTRAVVDANFELERGEIIGILGPNGAGKTTIFYIVAGLLTPDSGSVLLGGEDITRLPMYRRARLGVGYLPQESSILRRLTVEKNILSALEVRRQFSRKERLHRCDQIIETLHLEKIRKSLGGEISGGERRRCEIARALASDPSFLLLDEPFAGIDPISIAQMKTIISNLSTSRIGVILIDHNVRDALEVTRRLYIIDSGRVVAHGSAQDVLKSSAAQASFFGNDFLN